MVFGVKLSDEDIADFEVLRDVAMATIFGFLWVPISATWRIRLNRPCAAAMRPYVKLECEPMPNVMAALPNIGGALCSTPQSLADAHY